MKAVGKFILAIPQEQVRSAGGILLPVDATQQVQYAVVESKGEQVEVIKPDVNVKATIMYNRNDAIHFKSQTGANMVAITEEKVIAVDYE